MRLPLLCSNQYHPIGGLTTIQSCRWSSFQDTDTLYILRIQIGNAISSVTVAGIDRSTYGRVCLLGSGVQNGNTVYHIQRLVVTRHRADSTDTDFG